MLVVITDADTFRAICQTGLFPRTGAWIFESSIELISWDNVIEWMLDEVAKKEWYASRIAGRTARTLSDLTLNAKFKDSFVRLERENWKPIEQLFAVVTWEEGGST